jgi:F0F1-type ATP synthase assembly protein I
MATKPTRGTAPTPTFDVSWLALSGEIGLKLAVPLVILMLTGIKLDRALHTTPLFILLGIALSLTASIIMIGRMVIRSMRDSS